MISKTKINKKVHNKRSLELIETIILAKKKNLLGLAKKLTCPKRLYSDVNLSQLNASNNKEIIVVGRVLGSGDIEKKIEVAALGFSKQALEKLKKSGSSAITIKEKIQKDPQLEGVEII